jgi:RNA polymerase sigma-70 factor (ECF subfamily)
MVDELFALRPQLLAYCYRMLGSPHDAEDVTQVVMMRAHDALASFAERSSLKTWVFRIATHACLDELKSAHRRRELPVGNGRALGGDDDAPQSRELGEWIGPLPPLAIADAGPEARYTAAAGVRLAFVAALQRLSPKQRAALILCDVVGFRADEAASVLDLSVSSVNGALHRARVVLDKDAAAVEPGEPDEAVLDAYVRAWEHNDVAALAKILADEVRFSMPPNPAWFDGKADVVRYIERRVLAHEPPRSRVLWRTKANELPAFAVYLAFDGKPLREHAVHVLDLVGGRIGEIVSFHDRTLFPLFGAPPAAELA